jgi:hypothetical protein
MVLPKMLKPGRDHEGLEEASAELKTRTAEVQERPSRSVRHQGFDAVSAVPMGPI